MDTTPKKNRTIAESDHDLTRKIQDLDWDDQSEITVVIQHPQKGKDEPTTGAQIVWRTFHAIPSTKWKVAIVVTGALSAALTRWWGFW